MNRPPLTFNEYQSGTFRTAAYAAEAKEPERLTRLNELYLTSILSSAQILAQTGGYFDGFKKFIRDGKRPAFGMKSQPGTGERTSLAFPNSQYAYVFFGLLSEAGEVAEKFNGFIKGETTKAEFESSIMGELGDLLWYMSECCRVLGMKLEDVAGGNLAKLASRQERDKIHGSGDNR